MRALGKRNAAVAAITLAGTAAVAVTVQQRHLRGLAGDPDFARLTAPRDGRPLSVRSADGTALHAEVFGAQDGDTLVLAHGWTEQLSYWGPVIDRLSEEGLRLVAYDLRGHGASDSAARGDYSLDRFGEDVDAVLASAVSEGERAIVAGHSLGAMSIAAWAEHHDVRARVRAVALLNTGFGDLVTGHRLFGELAAKWLNNPWASELVLGSSAPLPGFSTPLQQWFVRYSAFGPAATAGEVAFYERMLLDCPPDVRSACAKAMFEMDLWEAVTQIDVPTLVLTGSDDRLTPPAHARRIAEALPDLAKLVELPETGHMAPLERPDEVSEALAGLVTRTSPAAV